MHNCTNGETILTEQETTLALKQQRHRTRMKTDDELFEHLRRCPMGRWTTVELMPWGYWLAIQSDGNGVVIYYSGLAQEKTHFEWRLDSSGEFQVRLTGDGDAAESDSEYRDWHSSPYQLTPAVSPHSKRLTLAIKFRYGLLCDRTFPLLDAPLLFDGAPAA